METFGPGLKLTNDGPIDIEVAFKLLVGPSGIPLMSKVSLNKNR